MSSGRRSSIVDGARRGERECLFSCESISFFNEIISIEEICLLFFFCVARARVEGGGVSSPRWREDNRSALPRLDVDLSEKTLVQSSRPIFSNPNQRHDSQWANEWRQYKWPTREHIVLNNNLSKNLFPEHGFAHRAEFCSFWLDFIPKMVTSTCASSLLVDLRHRRIFSPFQRTSAKKKSVGNTNFVNIRSGCSSGTITTRSI